MIRFLVVKYYFRIMPTYSTYYLYNKTIQPTMFKLDFFLQSYLVHLSSLRLYYRQQINYRVGIMFLSRRFGATHKLTGYFMRKGLLRLWLNFFRLYYIQVLRINFLSVGQQSDLPYLFKYKDTSFFTSIYYFYDSIKDFDRILIWRLFQVNTLFRYTLGIYRKKGKKKCSLKFEFVSYKKRIYVAWRWLSLYFTLMMDKLNAPYKLYYGLESFLIHPSATHPLTLFKLEIYKAKLLQMV